MHWELVVCWFHLPSRQSISRTLSMHCELVDCWFLKPSVVVYFRSVTRMATFNLAFEKSKVPGPLISNMGGLTGSGIIAFTYFEWQ